MNVAQPHKDIQSYIDAISYGDVELKIKRVNKKTVEITTKGQETLRYSDTEAALGDIIEILKNLVDTGYSGRAHIECTYNDGEITLVAIHDEKQTKY